MEGETLQQDKNEYKTSLKKIVAQTCLRCPDDYNYLSLTHILYTMTPIYIS